MRISKQTVGTLLLAACMAVAASLILWNTWYIRRYGVYVVATKTGTSGGGRQAGSSIYKYSYGGLLYKATVRDYGGGAIYRFVKVLPNRPSSYFVTSDSVPNCLRNSSLPKFGWDNIPTCTDSF